jgi:ABC-type uncharacterized transport system permease subunit
MEALLPILRTLLPFLYAALVWLYGGIFFRKAATSRNILNVFPVLVATIVTHAVYIGVYTMATGHCLLTTIFELSSLIAFTVITVFSFAESRFAREASGTGFLVALVAFCFQLISSLFIGSTHESALPAIMSDPIFNVHVTTSVFGYAALTLASIYGTLYLLLFRAIKLNKFGPVFENLPNLERLERAGFRTTFIGFIFLTISILFGALLVRAYPPATDLGHWILDPKVLATLLVWLVFGATLLARRVAKVEGRQLVLLWMSGFALTIISMTIVNAFVTEFHSFL